MPDRDLLLALIRAMMRCAKTFITLMERELKQRGLHHGDPKNKESGKDRESPL